MKSASKNSVKTAAKSRSTHVRGAVAFKRSARVRNAVASRREPLRRELTYGRRLWAVGPLDLILLLSR